MRIALFNVADGELVKTYESDDEARRALRQSNNDAGWKRLRQSWVDGYECEYCTNGKVSTYGPYGITEYDRWDDRINPNQYKRAS